MARWWDSGLFLSSTSIYIGDHKSNGATALGGLPVYVELAKAVGLRESVARHVGARRPGGQGWTDAEMVLATVLLNC